jgi:pimeloyl-ACP methyl ester carboxylesterase
MSAARVKTAASRIADPDKRRQFLNGTDAMVAALSNLRQIYSGPAAARQKIAKRGFSTRGLQPLTGAELAHWRRGNGGPFLPPDWEEPAVNPGILVHPSGLVEPVSPLTQQTARGKSTGLLLTFGGTTAGLTPATSSARRAVDNLGEFFAQWRNNYGAHRGQETAVDAAAKDLLGAALEQTRLKLNAGQRLNGGVLVAGHSLGGRAAILASAELATSAGITPVIAIDSPGVRYSAKTMARLETLGRKTGRTAEQVLRDAHIHIYGEGDPVVGSADLPMRGGDVVKPIAREFEMPDTENRNALANLRKHNSFDDMVLDARFNEAIPSAVGQSLDPRRARVP